MGSPTAPLDLTLSTMKGQSQGHSVLEGLYRVEEPSEAICYCQTQIGNHIWEVQWHIQILPCVARP